MVAIVNRQVRLTRLPGPGLPADDDFELVEAAVPELSNGEVLLRSIYLSMDPYQRVWMAGIVEYVHPAAPGRTVIGRAVSQVVASRDDRFREGDFVHGETGWQTHPVVSGNAVRKIDPSLGPISTAIGVLGSSGLTAYVGIDVIGRPEPGETVVVSAAAGAVGSIAGQIAKIKGARVIGIAGPPEKCRHVVDDLGFDDCLSYRSADLEANLARACPNGVDVYFDNTGGSVTDAVYAQLRVGAGARIALCGLIAEYNTPEARGPNLKHILYSQSSITAVTTRGNLHRMEGYQQQASAWIRDGRLRYRESIVQGIENAPAAFRSLFKGGNLGKQLVQVSDDPTKEVFDGRAG